LGRSKTETFLGFALKKGAVKAGGNACMTLKKAYLVIVCESSAENSVRLSGKLARKFGCARYKTCGTTLAELIHKDNAKIVAITDKDLAAAITASGEKDITLMPIGE